MALAARSVSGITFSPKKPESYKGFYRPKLKGAFATSFWLLPDWTDARSGIIVTTIANIGFAYFIGRLQDLICFQQGN